MSYTLQSSPTFYGRACPFKIHWKMIVKLLPLVLAILLTLPAEAKTTPKLSEPDVLVFIQLTGTNMDFVSFTYPKVVSKTQAMTHLNRVTAETGWQALDLRITNNSLLKSGSNPMTSVEFVTPQAVKLELGGLPVEPFVKAFKDLNHIELVYATPPNFIFQGLRQFENKYVKIVLQRGTNTYRYLITIKDSNFETLGLPFLQPETPSAPKTERPVEHKSRTFAVILIIILALVAGALTYKLVGRLVYSGRSGR